MLTAEQAQVLAQAFVQQLEIEFPTTKRVLAALPQDQLSFKLGEKGRTAAELMWHIVESEIWFGEGVLARDFSPAESPEKPPATVAAIVERFENAVPALIEKLKAMTGEQLAQPINFMGVANAPAVMYLGWWAHHTIHHRGQLSTYLRALNAHVPTIYGGSADEPFQAAAGA